MPHAKQHFWQFYSRMKFPGRVVHFQDSIQNLEFLCINNSTSPWCSSNCWNIFDLFLAGPSIPHQICISASQIFARCFLESFYLYRLFILIPPLTISAYELHNVCFCHSSYLFYTEHLLFSLSYLQYLWSANCPLTFILNCQAIML